MIWNILTAIATLASTIAYIITALYIRAELKSLEKDRYLSVTGELFALWQSPAFMQDQLWLLHRLKETTWHEFVAAHRGEQGEAAFHRVGSFYDRVGTLVKMGLVNQQEILSTIGGYAIAVWQKVEPLVRDARRIENSVLFDDFERLLPACYECYVPARGPDTRVDPFSLTQPRSGSPLRAAAPPVEKITPARLHKRLEKGEAVTVLDVRQAAHAAQDPRIVPGAVRMPPDEVAARYGELPAEREVVAYCT